MKKRLIFLLSAVGLLPCFAADGGAGASPSPPALRICSEHVPLPHTLVRSLLGRDARYLPPARWGELFVTTMQADEDFLVLAITGYTSGRDANTLFVYQPGEKDWKLSGVLDIENLGQCRVQLEDVGEREWQISVLPLAEPSTMLPYVHTFELPENPPDVPLFYVLPEGVVREHPVSREPESVHVYLRWVMEEPLNLRIVSMSTDATENSFSLESVHYANGEQELGGAEWDDVFIGDTLFNAVEFLQLAKRKSCFQNLMLPRAAIVPGSIEMGWAYDAASSQWLLLLRHENGSTWSYDEKNQRFEPSQLTDLPFFWGAES